MKVKCLTEMDRILAEIDFLKSSCGGAVAIARGSSQSPIKEHAQSRQLPRSKFFWVRKIKFFNLIAAERMAASIAFFSDKPVDVESEFGSVVSTVIPDLALILSGCWPK